jgi:putative phage-type endonuclease
MGIGGSDATVLMGGGFKGQDRDQLLLGKLSGKHDDFENPAMKRGKRKEPIARKAYEALTGRTMKPICVEHNKFPWLRASLDGWNEKDGIILEIKCMGDWNHAKVLKTHEVPWYYKAQGMHQLLATDRAHKVHWWFWTDSDTFPPEEQSVLVEMERDQEYLDKLFFEEARAMAELEEIRSRCKENR